MAQDIIIAGNTYTDVPSVVFPTASGTAEFHDMSDPMSFLGVGAELVNGNLYEKKFKLSETLYNGWTPSTTTKAIIASETHNNAFAATDMDNYEYFLVWECGIDPVYNGSETLKALPTMSMAYLVQEIYRRPSSWANVQAGNANGNVCASMHTSTFMRYYGSTTGSITYTWSTSYGFYFTLTAATFSSSTADSPNINLKTPVVNARCHSSYFSTGNAALVDQDASTGYIRCKVYRIKQPGFMRGVYDHITAILNEE